MRQTASNGEVRQAWTSWLLELPPHTERTMRMESLIARLRLVVVAVNVPLLAVLLDTSGWNLRWAWSLIAFTLVYVYLLDRRYRLEALEEGREER